LTGLANRQLFDDTLEHLLHPRRRAARGFALLLLDVDRFKRINDTLGHLQGDAVIRTVAQTALAQVRKTDVLCRWGGEELILLAFDCGLDDAAARAESLRETIAATPIILPDDGTRVTVSVGVTAYQPADTIDTILSRADRALYRAKADGRDCVRIAEQLDLITSEQQAVAV
jgi:diguanylate cyclase (GGDEF)-like protein